LNYQEFATITEVLN